MSGITDTLRETLPRRTGRTLNGLQLHDVRRVHEDGHTWYSKRRRMWTEPFLCAVNAYLRSFRLDVRFLQRDSWARWEIRLHGVLRGAEARRHGAGVLLPEVPGVSLDRYLSQAHLSIRDKERALAAAASSLASLHAARVDVEDVAAWPLSHGDAVLRNVLLDETTGEAHWIDFETRHETSAPAPRRRADDVWTFARSAAFHLGEGAVGCVAAIVGSACIDDAVRDALRSEVTHSRLGEGLFRLAQAPISRATRDRLAAALSD